LLLLEFLARELTGGRLLVIGTYRDVELSRQHPLAEALGELTWDRLFQRVLLRGLGQEDVGRFIELVAGITPPLGMVEAVYRQTEGNPLFVTEVVRFLVQEGALTPDVGAVPRGRPESWTVRIPEGVKEVIGRRLNRLSQRCNQTLTIASVIGREFSLGQLKPLIEDMSEDRLLEVLEEALAARVVEELPRAVGRYQFTHALIQETLLGELSLTRRVRLHARIAEALEKLYGEQAEGHAAELAHHFAEAQTVLGTVKLVRYSQLAGERALASYGWEEAQAHFQRGLTAKGVSLEAREPAKDAQEAALLFGLGRAQAATVQRHQVQEVVATMSRAFDYYAAVRDMDRAVAIAEHPFYPVWGRRIGVARLIVEALDLVPPESHAAGRLLSRYGRVMGAEEGDYEGAREAFGRALAIAKRQGDEVLEMRTLAEAANIDMIYLRYRETLDKCKQIMELIRRVDDPPTEVLALYSSVISQFCLGDLEGLRRSASDMMAPTERLRDRFWLASAFRSSTLVSRLEGDWQAAREASDHALAVLPTESRDLCLRTLLEYEVGDLSQGEVYLERLLEVMRLTLPGPAIEYALPAMVIPVVARATGVVDRLDVAKEAAETILSAGAATLFVTTFARVSLALRAVLQGDVAAAGEQYAALGPLRGTVLLFAGVVGDRLLGLLAQTIGNLDKAAEHFEDALAFCRKAGYRPELAWACCDYADCLLQRSSAVAGETSQPVRPFGRLRAGSEPVEGRGSTSSPRTGGTGSPRTEAQQDRRKAMALLDEALRISRELGMRPLMERVLSRREILQA
jgi:tetratricopeptide (TPR) repeat protein